MLNSHVRTVRRSSLFSPAALTPALSLIRMENHMGIGIGKNLPLGGVRVELGWVGEDSGIGGGALPALILTAKEDGGQTMVINTALGGKPLERASHTTSSFPRAEPVPTSRLAYSRRDDRSPQSSDSGRDAQRLSQSYTSSSYLTSDEEDESAPSIMERALGQTGQRKVQQYLSAKKRLEAEQAQWRLAKKQSTSYASLPYPQANESGDSNTHSTAHRAFGGRGTALSRVEAPQLPSSRRKRGTGERRDSLQQQQERKLDEEVSHVDAAVLIEDMSPSAAMHLPYAANLYHFSTSRSSSKSPSPKVRPSLPSVNSSGDGRVISSRSSSFPSPSNSFPRTHVTLMYRLQAMLLFNLPLYLSRTALACVFLLLLFIRSGLSLVILSSTFQLVRWLFVFALLFYPLAPICVPPLGLLTLVSSSTHACRCFAASVVLSLINDVVVLVGSVYSFNTSMGYVDALLLPPIAVLVTLALLMTAHAYVAHLEVLKDLVTGRREHSRERDGDGGSLIVSQSPQSSRKTSRRGSLQPDAQQSERREKQRAAKYAARVQEAEAKSEDSSQSQPPTPSTAASEEPSTPIQQRDALASSNSSPRLTPTSHTAPMAVPTYPSPPSVFVPTLSPVLPTPPSMGHTPHSLLASSFASAAPPVDLGSPPTTPASAISTTPKASPTSSRSPVSPHSPSAAHPPTAPPASTRVGRGGSGASSAASTPTGARRGRGGGRGGGGSAAAATLATAGTRGKAKRGAKRAV